MKLLPTLVPSCLAASLLPFIPPFMSSSVTQIQPSVSLSDILGTHRSISTFFSLARQHPSVELLLATTASPSGLQSNDDAESKYNSDGNQPGNIVVLAPLNTAIEALPRKPWEDPRDYAAYGSQAYDGSGGLARAQNNVKALVEAHVLPLRGAWEEGVKQKTLGGRTVWWERRSGARVVMPDGVEVERVASRVANGELWILKGVLNYAP